MTSGGKRKGAGRPKGSTAPEDTRKTYMLCVRLTEREYGLVKQHGMGNVSVGVRRVIASFFDLW